MNQIPDVTQLLINWNNGDQEALDRLIPLVYAELHRQARRYMKNEGPGHLLQTTALINEAYLRLIDQKVRWQNRAHFFAIASQMMRRILVDYARKRICDKRGGNLVQVQLDEVNSQVQLCIADIIAVDEALHQLSQLDPRRAQVVELRFFGGLNTEEIAQVLNISPITVLRDWNLARAWLVMTLSDNAMASLLQQ